MNRSGVQAFEAKALAVALEIDRETVIVGETEIEDAGVYEISSGQEIGSLAGVEMKEEIAVEFGKDKYEGEPAEGMMISARGNSWRVLAVFGRSEGDIAWYLKAERQ